MGQSALYRLVCVPFGTEGYLTAGSTVVTVIECRKTKTKVITLTNHNRRKQDNEPIRNSKQIHVNDVKRGKTRASKSFCFYLWLVEKVVRVFFNQLQSVVKQKQSKRESLSTLSWTPLYFVNQSEVKPKPTVTCSHAFSRVFRRLHVFASNFVASLCCLRLFWFVKVIFCFWFCDIAANLQLCCIYW